VGAGTGATAGAAAGAWAMVFDRPSAITPLALPSKKPVTTRLANDRRGWKFIGKRIDGKKICNLI
jgi:hypothetical protein